MLVASDVATGGGNPSDRSALYWPPSLIALEEGGANGGMELGEFDLVCPRGGSGRGSSLRMEPPLADAGVTPRVPALPSPAPLFPVLLALTHVSPLSVILALAGCDALAFCHASAGCRPNGPASAACPAGLFA